MKKLVIVLGLLIVSIFIIGCGQPKSVGPCGSGETQCVPDYLVFKTVDVDYQNYLWGYQSIDNTKYFWGGLDVPPLSETLAPLNGGYYFRLGISNEEVSFFEKSLSQSGWRKIPTDETLKEEREKLIIKEPFTELFVCSHELFDEQYIKEELGLYGDDYTNYIKSQINKMIDEGTLSQNCEKKV